VSDDYFDNNDDYSAFDDNNNYKANDAELDALSEQIHVGMEIRESIKKLRGWVTFLDQKPSLAEVEVVADKIMDDLNCGFPETREVAATVIGKVFKYFERLDLRDKWFKRLMNLIPSEENSFSKLTRIEMFECLTYYYIHRGDPARAKAAVASLIDILSLQGGAPEREARLKHLALRATQTMHDDDLMQALDILDFARHINDPKLTMFTYSVLSFLYCSRYNAKCAFEYGQMAYILSKTLDYPAATADSLHYMALAFRPTTYPQRAFRYLKLAVAHNTALGDKQRLSHIALGAGLTYYQHKQYAEAESAFKQAVIELAGRGLYYAQAVYMLGVVQTKLGYFEDARRALTKAMHEYKILNMPFDLICTKHAMACLYGAHGDFDKAITWGTEALENAKASDDARKEDLIEAVKEDLRKFRRGLSSDLTKTKKKV
jgi:tetratricopeptide (TPR) repeat protein